MPIEELPSEGSQEEAEELVRRFPVKLPSFELKRVNISLLNVDYAPPHGTGYARPLSAGRLNRLRREWDPFACGALVLSRRYDGSIWIIDGNHRRVVAYEKGITQLPAMLFADLERPREADLYTKLGTVLGQTPLTRFQSKIIAGDAAAMDILRIVESQDLRINIAASHYAPGYIQAVARVEWIYARGGPEALDWVLGVLVDAWDGERDSLTELMLEGVFQFWLRYADAVDVDMLTGMLQGMGVQALNDRADAILHRIAISTQAALGRAMEEVWNQRFPASRLTRWDKAPTRLYQDVTLNERGSTVFTRQSRNPAPQHLGE
jgi:hypothetical protein